jgi:hypothetical protein
VAICNEHTTAGSEKNPRQSNIFVARLSSGARRTAQEAATVFVAVTCLTRECERCSSSTRSTRGRRAQQGKAGAGGFSRGSHRGWPLPSSSLSTYHPAGSALTRTDGTSRSSARSNCAVIKPPGQRGQKIEILTGSKTPGTGIMVEPAAPRGRPQPVRGRYARGMRATDRFSRARPMYRSHDRECPRCGGPAHRVKRRKIDRLISLLFPRRRFRCGSMGCGWEGNLPLRPSPAPLARKR